MIKLNLRPKDNCLVRGDIHPCGFDGVLDDAKSLGVDRFGQNLEGFLEWIHLVNEVDVNVFNVDEAVRHAHEAHVPLLLDVSIFDDGVDHHVLTHLFDFVLRQLGIFHLDDFRNQHLVDDFGVNVPRHAFEHVIVLEQRCLEVIQV